MCNTSNTVKSKEKKVLQADVYKGVINDVIGQVKEAFLDENVDIDVLQQLKKVCRRLNYYYLTASCKIAEL